MVEIHGYKAYDLNAQTIFDLGWILDSEHLLISFLFISRWIFSKSNIYRFQLKFCEIH